MRRSEGNIEKVQPIVVASFVLGVTFVVGMSVFGYFFYISKLPQKTLSVTGSARELVVSDIARWSSSYSVKVSEPKLNQGFRLMKEYEKRVLEAFKKYGIADEEISLSAISVTELYMEPGQATERQYVLTQRIDVQTSDVSGIAEKVKNITQEILDLGVAFQANPVEYYYSKLAEKRVQLLSSAVRDARRRAEEIAKSGGLRIGKVISAKSGVVQVLAPNSVEISDYGTYDTSTKEKEIMVTVNITFEAK